MIDLTTMEAIIEREINAKKDLLERTEDKRKKFR